MAKNYWLVKSDPDSYSWDDFTRDGKTDWTGVRNFQARNHLRAMKSGDEVLFYHSQFGKDIIGLARVSKESYQDPTSDSEQWVAVELSAGEKFARSVALDEMKKNPVLQNIGLVRQSRLSVMPVTQEEYSEIIRLSASKN